MHGGFVIGDAYRRQFAIYDLPENDHVDGDRRAVLGLFGPERRCNGTQTAKYFAAGSVSEMSRFLQ
jgi:hypothetical protein